MSRLRWHPDIYLIQKKLNLSELIATENYCHGNQEVPHGLVLKRLLGLPAVEMVFAIAILTENKNEELFVAL